MDGGSGLLCELDVYATLYNSVADSVVSLLPKTAPRESRPDMRHPQAPPQPVLALRSNPGKSYEGQTCPANSSTRGIPPKENCNARLSCSASSETWIFSSNFLTAARPGTMRCGQTSLAESRLRRCSALRRNGNCLAGGNQVQEPCQLQPHRRSKP